MLLEIGRREARLPDDVAGKLLDCHARIRTFSTMAVRLARGEGTDAEIAEAASRVERYFRVALPLHVADEEISLRPRLLAAGLDAAALAALDKMSEEHVAIEARVESLVPRWAQIAQNPQDLKAMCDVLLPESEELAGWFEAHLAAEEQVLFPVIRDKLAAEAPAIAREMAARRTT